MTKDQEFKALAGEITQAITSSVDSGELPGFEEFALRIFRFQFAHNMPYQSFCRARNRTPESVRRASQVPAMPTSGFKELALTVLPPEERRRVFRSSGTTAQKRGQHYHNELSLTVYERSAATWFQRHVLEGLHRPWILSLTPSGSEVVDSSLIHMFETVAAEYGGKVCFAGRLSPEGAWELQIGKIMDFAQAASSAGSPVVILSTAFSLVQLCDAFSGESELDSSGLPLRFPAGTRIMETGGYKGRSREVSKADLYHLIQEKLGIPPAFVITEYGMSELSSQAYDGSPGDNQPRSLQFPPWARAEVISPETGEPVPEGGVGLVRIYDLANLASVMAVQTEDLAIRHRSGFELLGRAPLAEPRGCSLMAGDLVSAGE